MSNKQFSQTNQTHVFNMQAVINSKIHESENSSEPSFPRKGSSGTTASSSSTIDQSSGQFQLLPLATAVVESPHIPAGCLSVAMPRKRENPTTKRSPARQLLWERTLEKHTFPLPSTQLPTRITIGTLSTMLNIMKGSVDWAQVWPSGRKGTLPALLGTTVKKVRVPRITMGGRPDVDIPDPMNAEFIHNSKSSRESKKRCILYMHGGAYVLSSRRTHRGITSRLAVYADSTVFSIDYRLAPQHVFPGPLVDVLSAYQFLLQNGFEPENICFCGDSAGGGLSTAAMIYCRDSQNTESPIPIPGCIAVMSPFNDMTQSLPAWYLNEPYCYLPEAVADQKYFSDDRHCCQVGHDKDLCNPYASPAMSKSIPGLPICPTLIQMGDAERVRDDSIYFATQTMSSDEPIQVEMYEDAVHVFQLFSPFDAFGDHALKRMGKFIQENTVIKIKKPFVKSNVKVFNDKLRGYPTIDIPDLEGILTDGVELCLRERKWRIQNDIACKIPK